MSNVQLDPQVIRQNSFQAPAALRRAAERFDDIELGTPPASPAGARAPRPAPQAPVAVARDAQRVTDPRSWIHTVGGAALGLTIGLIGTIAYVANKAAARENDDDPCYDDHNGNSICRDVSGDATRGGVVAAWMLVPTSSLAALTMAALALSGKWTISRGDLEARDAASQARAASNHHRPIVGGGGLPPGFPTPQAWNQAAFNDNQAIGNGQLGSGIVIPPFNP